MGTSDSSSFPALTKNSAPHATKARSDLPQPPAERGHDALPCNKSVWWKL